MLRIASCLFGLVFCLGGLMALAATQGWVPSAQVMNPATMVFTLMGAVLFTAAGLGLVLWGLGLAAWAARMAVLAALAFVLSFNWIAFGPGERRFTGGVSASAPLVGAEATRPMSEAEGRTVFGLFSLALDGLALLAVAAWWRGRR